MESEQKLVSADCMVKLARHAYGEWNLAMAAAEGNRQINHVFKMQELCKAVESVVKAAPAVDPETLPLVQELRLELARYQQAEKEGRLIELPCEVGRTVYTLFCGKVVEKRIGKLTVNGYTNPRIWVDIDCDWATTQSVRWDLAIGKTVFLTIEEAEAALKQREAP